MLDFISMVRKSYTLADFVRLTALFMCIFATYFVNLRIRQASPTYDDALNAQVSVSLAKTGMYARTHLPRRIYDPAITTNGPVQYVMAAAVASFGTEQARVVVLTLFFVGLLAALAVHSIYLAAYFSLLTIVWPRLLSGATLFLGELPALAFCVFGLWAWIRFRREQAKKFFLLSGLAFGAAVSIKLIVALLVPFLLLASAGNAPRKYTHIARTLALALSTFLALYYFSVLHSLWAESFSAAAWRDWAGLVEFISNHFVLATQRAEVELDIRRLLTGNRWLILFLLGSGVISIYLNRAVALLWLLTAGCFYVFHFYERRLLCFLFFLFFYGAQAALHLLQKRGGISRRERGLLGLYFAAALASAALGMGETRKLLATTFTQNTTTDPAAKFRERFGGLGEAISQANAPILTGGWWQLPEVSLRTGVNFYDRMNSSNQYLRHSSGKLLFLFEKANENFWPYNSRRFCQGEPYYEDAITVFCEFNKEKALNQIGQTAE